VVAAVEIIMVDVEIIMMTVLVVMAADMDMVVMAEDTDGVMIVGSFWDRSKRSTKYKVSK
jgi:hypothetical protein